MEQTKQQTKKNLLLQSNYKIPSASKTCSWSKKRKTLSDDVPIPPKKCRQENQPSNMQNMSQKSSSAFIKRKGTVNRGVQYPLLIMADLILQLIEDETIDNFKVSMDNNKFGLFRHIVLEVETGGTEEQYAFHLKYVNNPAKTLINIKDLEKIDGDLSIQKYFRSYKENKDSSYCRFIVFTNREFNNGLSNEEKARNKSKIKILKAVPLKLLNFVGTSDYFFKFEITESLNLSSEEISEYKEFLNNFFLCTSQPNVEQVVSNIEKKFRELFHSHAESCYKQYLQFLSKWNLREGQKDKLDKMMLQRVIALVLLQPCTKPLCFGSVSNEMKICGDAITSFDVTLFEEEESYNKVKELWDEDMRSIKKQLVGNKEVINSENDIEVQNIIQAKIKYQALLEFDDIDVVCGNLLWLMGKCPIIVTGNKTTFKAVELCPNEKFILLGTELKNEEFKKSSVLKNLSDLESQQEIYKNVVDTLMCTIQGKGKVNLQFLIEQNEKLKNIVRTDDLVKIAEGSYNIGEEKEEICVPYINRFVTRTFIDIKYLERVDKNILIVLNSMKKINTISGRLGNFNIIDVDRYLKEEEVKHQESNYAKNDVVNTQHISLFHTSPRLDHFVSGPDIYQSINGCSRREFEIICDKNPQAEKFHHFKIIDENTLEWIRSRGDISDLEQFRLENHLIEESTLYQEKPENNINLIIGDPGMGKSEFMKNLKNNSSAKVWAEFLFSKDINSLCTYLEGKKSDCEDELQNFVLDTKYNTLPDFDKSVIKKFFENKQVVYFWDALDEISAKNLNSVTNLIQKLSSSCLFQWISSRCHLKKCLEKKFNVLSRNVSQFNDEDQTNYIYKRLINYYSEEDIVEVTKKIKHTVTLMQHNDILGVPLQIFMLTELFRKDRDKYIKFLEDTFSLTNIYHYIIEEKFSVFYTEKAELDSSSNYTLMKILKEHKNTRLTKYEKAAIKTLITREAFHQFKINCDDFLKQLQDNSDRIGVIAEVIDNFPLFLHNSYAEYFVAKYFVERYEDSIAKNEIDGILFKKKHKNINFFFDLLRSEGSSAHIAVLYENIDMLKKIEGNELKYCQDIGGRNVLQLACSWGKSYPILSVEKRDTVYLIDNETNDSDTGETTKYKEMLEYLLDNHDDPESLKYALPFAEKTDSLLTVLTLMILQKRRNEFNSTINNDDRGISILYYSSKFGYDEILDLFEELPFIKTKKDGFSLYHLAVTYGQEKYLQKLLAREDYSKFKNDRDKYGRTPLYRACQIGSFDIVELLVKAEVDLNAPTKDGSSPLHAACLHKHDKIVQYLLDSNASIDVVDCHGISPLHVACWNGHFKVVKILVEMGADVNVTANDGCTPLYVASRNSNDNAAIFLITLKDKKMINASDETDIDIFKPAGPIDLNLAQKDGVTPLIVACQEGHYRNVELLIKFGADIHLRTNSGESALYVACQNGHESVVDMLIRSGVDTNVSTNSGCTPLHIACQQGQFKVVQLLIAAGANVHACNNDGTTSLILARSHGHNTIVQLLENITR